VLQLFDEDFFKMYNENNEEQEKKDESIETVSFPVYDESKLFVLSVGGSLIAPEKPDSAFLSKFSLSLNSLMERGYRFAIVAGGGRIGRNYIAAAKTLGTNNYSLDLLGIAVTRVNALLLIQALENAYPGVLTDIQSSKQVLSMGKIPVFGGLLPGITTDAVAALLAEFLKADYVNLTNVDGIYSADPKTKPNAKFYPELSHDRLIGLMQVAESKPGQNLVLDLPCCYILKRSRIRGIVLNGSDLSNFERAIEGSEFKGTVIKATEKESTE